MKRKRYAFAAALVAAAVSAAGVAAATRHVQAVSSASSSVTATSVSQSHSSTCGTLQKTTATYTGTATSTVPQLNGALTIRAQSTVDSATNVGIVDGDLRIRGGAHAQLHAAIANGTAVGAVIGPNFVASFSSPFTQAGGFSGGSLGSGSLTGAGTIVTPGQCKKQPPKHTLRVFHVKLAHGAEGSLTLDLSANTAAFNVNYRLPANSTITSLVVKQGSTVVLDAATGNITDLDGVGNLTKVVSAPAATLQAIAAHPHDYSVELATSAGTAHDRLK
jgi:hypothetical protein